ncbi:MAG TPA: hypothetical protein GXX75_04175 [Clostridiales bacterium]|nr:hypothetical protein [Clostridiales bacterium]
MKIKFLLLLSLILITILAGCSKESHNKNILDNNNGFQNTLEKDDFEITITTERNTYSLNKLFKTEPLNISALIKYIGNKENISIWHGEPLCAITLVPCNGDSFGESFLDIKIRSIIQKDEAILISPDFQSEFYKDRITKGEYTAIAHLKLSLDKKGTQIVDFSAEIPFEIQ